MKDFFSGTYYRALDTKGRFTLPPAWQKVLVHLLENKESDAPLFWLTSLYGRLTAYLPEDWELTVKQLCSIKMPSLKLANFKSRLIGLGHAMRLDSHGRILLPQSLCKAASLSRNIVLVGLMNNFEIWDQERFEGLTEGDESISGELAAYGVEISL